MNAKLSLKNVRICNVNFAGREKVAIIRGRETVVNQVGQRNFTVKIKDPELAERLHNDGWNIKMGVPDPKDPDDTPTWYLPVKVNFNSMYPPSVNLIEMCYDREQNRLVPIGKRKLSVESVEMLDSTRIIDASMEINGSWHEKMPVCDAGYTAYLNTIWVSVELNPIEEEFSDIPWLE